MFKIREKGKRTNRNQMEALEGKISGTKRMSSTSGPRKQESVNLTESIEIIQLRKRENRWKKADRSSGTRETISKGLPYL